MTHTIRTAFAQRFGEDQAEAIYRAAVSHKNGVHDNEGSDPFKWALCICIGYQCMEEEPYRADHGITADWEEIQQWIKDHADLASHDGDVDLLAAVCGKYNEYIKQETCH